MFLEKCRAVSEDRLGREDFLELAREALLYGMRLERHPGRLKGVLKRNGFDSTTATSTWTGTYYLMQTLPQVLRDRKRKIPCLADFRFCLLVLSPEHKVALAARVDNLPTLTPSELLADLMPQIKSRAYRGRFLSMFDSMYDRRDVEQDLVSKALTIMNREWGNLRSHAPEDIFKYIGFCFDQKTKTYLTHSAPRAFREDMEDQAEMDRTVEQSGLNDPEVRQWTAVERDDLENILTPQQNRAVLLLTGEASAAEVARFKQFIESQGVDFTSLRGRGLEQQIEKFCGRPVWDELKRSTKFEEYLRG